MICLDPVEQEGGGILAVDALLLGLPDGLFDDRVDLLLRDFILPGHGIADQHAVGEPHLLLEVEDPGDVGGVVQPVIRAVGALGGIEGGQAVGAVADDGTPFVSRYSRVSGMSRMALGPAQTVSTGVRAISSRSAEISKDSGAPRWTPPSPPVAKIRMPPDAR